MLGAEQRHERDPCSSQPRHVADPIRIHPGLVRHQADPTAADQVHAVVEQHLDARLYPIWSGAGSACSRAADTRSPDSD
jgi:hypothetical protein